MEPVLAVDLDGTLIQSDLLIESALSACRKRLLTLFSIPGWLVQGKANLKQHLAQHAEIDVATLPWNLPLLAWLHEQRDAGRRLVLATASDMTQARRIARHLGDRKSVV